MIITIDGFVATGKSTIAKKLAEHLGFIFFDTGAMYRAVTYALLKNKISLEDIDGIEAFLELFEFEIKMSFHHERRYFIQNEDVTHQIRNPEVTSLVSKTSAIKAIRDKLVNLQRQQAKGINAVFEGRDMGTVVFPNAELKIFLTGEANIRAKRRYEECKAKYPDTYKDLTLEQCLADITQRDLFDSTREISPLCQPKDAKVIDTSNMTIEEVVYKIIEFKDILKSF